MKRKTCIIKLCCMLLCTMLITTVLPVLAEGEATPIDVMINANYYTTETDGEYKIVFTALSDIPAFYELHFKISLTDAKVDRAGFESGVVTGGETARYETYAIYEVSAETTQEISARTAFCSLEIYDAAVPTGENLLFSDFYLKDAENNTVDITPVVTLQAGPIIPELSQTEQAVYDSIVALPQVASISYYKEDTTLADISSLLSHVTDVQASYNALTATEKQNVDTVLEYYNYTGTVLEPLKATLTAMNQAKGLIEIAYTAKDLTNDNILKNQFLFSVYAEMKAGIDTTVLSVNPVASAELTDADSRIEGLAAILETALNAADFEDKTYSCGDQLTVIQSLSSHVYYPDYLDALKSQIDAVRTEINANYTGREESKQNLLTYLNIYQGSIQMIQAGIEDFPVMTCEDISRGYRYDVVFNRQKSLDDTISASIQVIVTDKDGDELENKTVSFPSDSKKLTISLSASRQTYPKDEKVTITAYYILDRSSFLLDSQDVNCVNTATNVSGIGGTPSGGIISTPPSTDNKEEEPSGSESGGTIFPSEETIETNTDTTPSTVFTDIGSYGWAKEAIEGLYFAGIINGMEEGIYNPSGVVTREQFSKMVVQLFGVSIGSTKTNFVDVNSNAWYAPYITAALQAGYIQGQSDEYFGVGESIMRQDMATILYRALGDQNSKAALSFSDRENIAPYAEDAIAELVGLGILNGYEDGRFLPRGTATRAEAAKAIWGIYQILNR